MSLMKSFFSKLLVTDPKLPISNVELPRPSYVNTVNRVNSTTYFAPTDQAEWYPPVMLSSGDLKRRVIDDGYVSKSLDLLKTLSPDAYTTYLEGFYADGLRRFGNKWCYVDIVVILAMLSDLIRPKNYLEIGVRRGRSFCTVANFSKCCNMYGFDMWVENYAGIENPGPDLVKQELSRVGHIGSVNLIDGDSHITIPQFLNEYRDLCFDLITVDGDHSEIGAAQDLADVLPRLSIGGAIVFDDIAHPLHPELERVWRTIVEEDSRFVVWSYKDSGYGVGCAIRKY